MYLRNVKSQDPFRSLIGTNHQDHEDYHYIQGNIYLKNNLIQTVLETGFSLFFMPEMHSTTILDIQNTKFFGAEPRIEISVPWVLMNY